MPKIKKRSGLEEDFQQKKIENSMRNAGISKETAEEVVGCIGYHEGITTSEVRNRIIGGIKNREPQAAMRYESHPKKNYEK